MATLYKRTIDFLMENELGYENPHGVVITLLVDLSVNVSVCNPEHKNEEHISLETFCSCNNLDDFLDVFKIKNFQGLGRIKPVLLQDLYSRGIGELYCLVGNYELTFRKKAVGMEVMDDAGNFHNLQALLHKGEEFIEYTRHYYKLEKTYPG